VISVKHVDIWSKGEVISFLRALAREGIVKECANLVVEEGYANAFYPRCSEDFASRVRAKNVQTRVTAYRAPSSYFWPKCPEDCPLFTPTEDFLKSLIGRGIDVKIPEERETANDLKVAGDAFLEEAAQPTEERFNVAFSLAHEQHEYVDLVFDAIRRSAPELRVFYYRDEVQEIKMWGKNIFEYLRVIYKDKSDHVVIFISAEYADKRWTRHEWRSVQEAILDRPEEYLLPARFDDTVLPGLPTTLSYVHLRNKAPGVFANMIVEKIKSMGTLKPQSPEKAELESKKPRLKILDFEKEQNLRDWHFRDTGWLRRAIALDVQNEEGLTAEKSVAIMRIIDKPQTVTRIERQYHLHWADVPYSMRTTGAEPIDIEGGVSRRLDVVFTDRDTGGEGCWIAIPMALTAPHSTRQAYLPPGQYKVRIEVSCANGTGDSKTLRITSPSHWRALDGEQTENE
jgi:hypothetical protein